MRKIAVVTGSSSGIGETIAQMLLENDFKVYGLSRSRGNIEHDDYTWIEIDLFDTESIGKIIGQIVDEKIDLLVNNAGTFLSEEGLNYTEENFTKIFNLNFKAPIVLTKTLKTKLKDSIVINISSISDRVPGEECGLYCASKAGLNMYFDCTALEEKEIKFISILPSYVDTPLLRKIWEGLETPFEWNEIIKPTHISNLVKKILENPDDFESVQRIIVITEAEKEDLEDFEKLKVYIGDRNEVLGLEEARRLLGS